MCAGYLVSVDSYMNLQVTYLLMSAELMLQMD